MLSMALASGKSAAAMTERMAASATSDAHKTLAKGDLQRALNFWRSGHFGGLAFYHLRAAPDGNLRAQFAPDGALTLRLPESWEITGFACSDTRRCKALVDIRFIDSGPSTEAWQFDLVLPPEGGFWQLIRAARCD